MQGDQSGKDNDMSVKTEKQYCDLIIDHTALKEQTRKRKKNAHVKRVVIVSEELSNMLDVGFHPRCRPQVLLSLLEQL